MRPLLALSLLLTGSFAVQASDSCAVECPASQAVTWSPIYSPPREGIYLNFYYELAGPPSVTIIAEVDGKRLPVTTGTPDKDGFVKTKIANLDTYKLLILEITINGKTWSLKEPRAGARYELRQ